MKIKIILYIVRDCPACKRALKILNYFVNRTSNLILITRLVSELKNNSVPIVPAVFVEEELFSIGEVNTERLAVYLAEKFIPEITLDTNTD